MIELPVDVVCDFVGVSTDLVGDGGKLFELAAVIWRLTGIVTLTYSIEKYLVVCRHYGRRCGEDDGVTIVEMSWRESSRWGSFTGGRATGRIQRRSNYLLIACVFVFQVHYDPNNYFNCAVPRHILST